ncbi:TPA: hypothetical protein DDZ86_03085 [Candidatus Dependentiae bacterium]|nr:MAG: Thiol:disulfide interchange protein [candidate division TM6 bacterium GW2011_GWF2_43_87]HBL98602.1 hypothetical protein [Candidatus Dependentiae bacterium]
MKGMPTYSTYLVAVLTLASAIAASAPRSEPSSPLSEPTPEITATTPVIQPQKISPSTTTGSKWCLRTFLKDCVKNSSHWCGKWLTKIETTVSNLVQKGESRYLRLFFIFLLGILMSLTPCIYPMIPITVGILQSSAQTSTLRNFLLASTYTCGIATTFAILGMLTASGSAHFGELMGNPFFVALLVLFLSYFAFSMLGFYELKLPQFLQGDATKTANGSFVSAFVFGALSGTIASPCLSPGLLLLLGIVAKLGSTFLGFLYLFTFGIGLCVPLILIGTFSSSTSMLPRAGRWMIEVKVLFGFMLLGLCLFYLKAIVPATAFYALLGGTLLFCGSFLFLSLEKSAKTWLRWYRYLLGALFIVLGLFGIFNAFKAALNPVDLQGKACALYTFEEARSKAIRENKALLIEFGASWCSSCQEINKKIMHNPEAHEKLSSVVIVSVDCTNPQEKASAQLLKQFDVMGFPTVLLVEPHKQKVLTRWGAEILSLSLEELAQQISPVNT